MRVCLRTIPGWFGFVWWQVAISTDQAFTFEHYWAARNIARAHRFGPVWICTMRKDWAGRRLA